MRKVIVIQMSSNLFDVSKLTKSFNSKCNCKGSVSAASNTTRAIKF